MVPKGDLSATVLYATRDLGSEELLRGDDDRVHEQHPSDF